ncbi:ribosomal-processing cysteine protease Prp [Cohnella suwonensis]|uniref:Ribosomal processing cysteine protease Prp n=1 Tax=Cohnella suwonensis TaxID=696072 RepID=A0ABW0LXV4_9BACL
MIKVTIVRDDRKAIIRFTVSGHAFYNDPGKDIVCAGVTAVTVGAINAIEKLTGLEPNAYTESGLLEATAPRSEEPARDDQVQLLLEGMVAALETIEDYYGKHVKIKEIFEQEGG